MDWLTKQKTQAWAIVLLVIINIATLVTLWMGRPTLPPMLINGRPDINNFLKNELGLNNDQENKFNLLRKSLFDSMDVINTQIWIKKSEIQNQAFKENPDTQRVNNLLQEIAGFQVLNEKLMFNHFTQLYKVLSADQVVKFHKLPSMPGRNDHKNISLRSSNGCDRWNASQHRGTANSLLVEKSVLSARRVHNQLDAVALDQINNVRTAFLDLEHPFHYQPRSLKRIGSALSGDDLEAEVYIPARQFNCSRLVIVVDGEKDRTLRRKHMPGRKLGLRKRLAESGRHAHHLARRLHLRAQNRIDTGKLDR